MISRSCIDLLVHWDSRSHSSWLMLRLKLRLSLRQLTLCSLPVKFQVSFQRMRKMSYLLNARPSGRRKADLRLPILHSSSFGSISLTESKIAFIPYLLSHQLAPSSESDHRSSHPSSPSAQSIGSSRGPRMHWLQYPRNSWLASRLIALQRFWLTLRNTWVNVMTL